MNVRKTNVDRIKVLFFLSAFCLVASALTHFSTFLGINPQRAFPPVWAFHVLLFVVWIPMVSLCREICAGDNRKDYWKIATHYAPYWMKVLCIALLVYTFFNFFFTIFVLNEGGVPAKLNGKKVLHSHGRVIRELTDEEYEKHQAYSVRTFSGHWMLFYCVAMTVFYSRMRQNSNQAFKGL